MKSYLRAMRECSREYAAHIDRLCVGDEDPAEEDARLDEAANELLNAMDAGVCTAGFRRVLSRRLGISPPTLRTPDDKA